MALYCSSLFGYIYRYWHLSLENVQPFFYRRGKHGGLLLLEAFEGPCIPGD